MRWGGGGGGGASLEIQWLRLLASMTGACLLSLIWELKSHMPRGAVGGWERNLMGIHGASWGCRIDGEGFKLTHTVVSVLGLSLFSRTLF